MIKVNLIILPSPFLVDQKRNCPLGILYIAAALEKDGHEVTVTDLRGVEEESWLQVIPEVGIHGISASSVEYPYALKVATMLKKRSDCRIILGGIHPTVMPQTFSTPFDTVVAGEGESIISKLVTTDSLCWAKVAPINALNQYPLPARHLLPPEVVSSRHLVTEGVPATAIIGSRGCPYQCAFCASPIINENRVRRRSTASIAEEISMLINQGITQFRFHDDTLTLNKRWLRELKDSLVPLGIKFRANARVDHLDDEAVDLLLESGCIDISLGVESANQATLEIIEKGQTVEQAKKAIALCNKRGLKPRLSMIIGLPGDFGDLSTRVIEFLEETQPGGVDLNSLIVFPGCKMFLDPKRYGIRFRPNYNLNNLRMLAGAAEGELEQDFTIEYDQMSNKELKYHRARVSEYIYERRLNIDD